MTFFACKVLKIRRFAFFGTRGIDVAHSPMLGASVIVHLEVNELVFESGLEGGIQSCEENL